MPAEKVYERYAWVVFFLLGIFYGSPGIYFLLIEGLDPVAGLIFLGFAILTVSVSVTGFRTGKKWAWYALWYVPPLLVVSTYVQVVAGEIGPFSYLLIAIPVLALLLPFRKFFPKRVGT